MPPAMAMGPFIMPAQEKNLFQILGMVLQSDRSKYHKMPEVF